MDANPLAAALQTQVVRALLAQLEAGGRQGLSAFLGQTLELLFQQADAGGGLLTLPGGQQIPVPEELPFASGTQLRVRVLPEAEGTVRLQILEARPPAAPAILQPLLAGEAHPLLARMEAEEPQPELEGLVRLLKGVLGQAAAASPLPVPEEVRAAVVALPPEMAKLLRQALALPRGQTLAEGLSVWMAAPLEEPLSSGAPTQAAVEVPGEPGDPPSTERLLQAFESRVAEAPLARSGDRALLGVWFRDLLTRAGSVPSQDSTVPASPSPAAGSPSPASDASMPLGKAVLTEGVQELSSELVLPLRRALGIPPAQTTLQGLSAWISRVGGQEGAASPLPAAPALMEAGTATAASSVAGRPGPPAGVPDEAPEGPRAEALAALLQRFSALCRTSPALSAEQKDFVITWFRDLLVRAESRFQGAGTPGETLRQVPGEVPLKPEGQVGASLRTAPAAARTLAPVLLPQHGESAQSLLEKPEFWGRWIREGAEALADPRTSPREAPFHALQAREGTAYFELPAPWLPQGVVQLWVEQDQGSGQNSGDPVRRVLLGLSLSRLGETRLGLELSGGALSARIWTEHPEMVAGQEEALRSELEETGCRVSLRVLSLPQGSPSLRALVVGAGWEGMG
nr:hypothetical protein [uncultured Holophaga sp.]